MANKLLSYYSMGFGLVVSKGCFGAVKMIVQVWFEEEDEGY
jgi:hypothetical protein